MRSDGRLLRLSLFTDFDLDLADSGALEGGPKAYRMTAYLANMDPEPIKMVGNVAAFFTPEESLPDTFKFNLSTASPGCTWKKVSGETIIELEDGMKHHYNSSTIQCTTHVCQYRKLLIHPAMPFRAAYI